LCQERGWTPVEYLDNDTSATNGKPRRAYERMLADVREGRLGAVVVWDLDRLHRSPIELDSFMALADDKHLALATVSGDVDLSTAQGRLVARLKGSVAAHEGEHRRARQLRATRQLAERGVPNWTRAFGYLGDTRQPDPATAPLVKQAYLAVLAGASLGDVCRLFNEAGALTVNGRPWTPTVVSKFLRKPATRVCEPTVCATAGSPTIRLSAKVIGPRWWTSRRSGRPRPCWTPPVAHRAAKAYASTC